jgi:hypothetical protein
MGKSHVLVMLPNCHLGIVRMMGGHRTPHSFSYATTPRHCDGVGGHRTSQCHKNHG